MDRTPEAMNQNESLPMAFVRNFATLMRDVTDKDRKSAKSLFVHVVAVEWMVVTISAGVSGIKELDLQNTLAGILLCTIAG